MATAAMPQQQANLFEENEQNAQEKWYQSRKGNLLQVWKERRYLNGKEDFKSFAVSSNFSRKASQCHKVICHSCLVTCECPCIREADELPNERFIPG